MAEGKSSMRRKMWQRNRTIRQRQTGSQCKSNEMLSDGGGGLSRFSLTFSHCVSASSQAMAHFTAHCMPNRYGGIFATNFLFIIGIIALNSYRQSVHGTFVAATTSFAERSSCFRFQRCMENSQVACKTTCLLHIYTHTHTCFNWMSPKIAWQYEQAIIHIVLLPTSFRWKRKTWTKQEANLSLFYCL